MDTDKHPSVADERDRGTSTAVLSYIVFFRIGLGTVAVDRSKRSTRQVTVNADVVSA